MYGYKIVNGKAVVNEQEAAVIVSLFDGYIAGLSMKAAAENAGVNLSHSSVKRILSRIIYIGDDYYPAIISRQVFAKATARRIHRAHMHEHKKSYTPPKSHKRFRFSEPTEHFDDPVQQAEYLYSLIEVQP